MKRSAAREVAVRLCYSAEIAAMENAEFDLPPDVCYNPYQKCFSESG